MPSGDFQDLARTQKETARALETLASELRRGRRSGDLRLLTGPLAPTQGRESLATQVIREIPPSVVAGSRVAGSVEGLGSIPQGTGDVERTLQATREVIRELGSSLNTSTRDLERALAGFSGGLQGLLAGLAGSGGGGFGGFLKSGFGLAGLGLKIAGLFGKKQPEPVTFTPFELPPGLSFEAANTSNILGGLPRVDRGQSDEPRSFRRELAAQQPRVVINVNALDTQSFLDRSSDIASAVRDAMLHMHPINDMIGEL